MKTNEQLLMRRVRDLKRQRKTLRDRIIVLEKELTTRPLRHTGFHDVAKYYEEDHWKNTW